MEIHVREQKLRSVCVYRKELREFLSEVLVTVVLPPVAG